MQNTKPVPMMSEHPAHLTSLPIGFRTWLWQYTCLLLLMSMFGHRQAIFESKGHKLSSSAECRIRSWKVSDTNSPADWMPTHKPTEESWIKLKTWTQQPVLIKKIVNLSIGIDALDIFHIDSDNNKLQQPICSEMFLDVWIKQQIFRMLSLREFPICERLLQLNCSFDA